jgi:hydroxymethylpyrimidine pyrophosphatase-like HAD family hydrolase
VEIHRYENDYSPGWHWLTVHDRRATKDQAIRVLRDRYGLADHELVVFGDHHNDVKMFAVADRAVAVANAIDAVKACATEVIGSNREGSVPEFIRNDWRGGGSGKGNRE